MSDQNIHYLHQKKVDKLEDLVHAIDKKLDVTIHNQQQQSEQLKDLSEKVNSLAAEYEEAKVKRRFVEKVAEKIWPVLIKLVYLSAFGGVMYLLSPSNKDSLLMALLNKWMP